MSSRPAKTPGSRGPVARADNSAAIALAAEKHLRGASPLPPPPETMGPTATREYQRIVELMGERLTAADHGVLCAYAGAFAEVAAHEKALMEEGYTCEGDRGAVLNPRVRAHALARKTLLDASAALGLTPAARIRLGQAPVPSSELRGAHGGADLTLVPAVPAGPAEWAVEHGAAVA